MNKKGFTLVELITSFALAAVVLIFVFNVVVILKNDYIGKSLKTSLLTKQSILSQKINEDFKDNNVIGVRTCDANERCYEFTFVDNTTKRLSISSDGKTIKYGDYKYELNSTSYTDKISVNITKASVNSNSINDSFLTVNLPIYNSKYSDLDFGINCTYQFNSNINDLSVVIGGDYTVDQNEWGNLADEEDVIPNLFTYSILNAGNKTAAITGINHAYDSEIDYAIGQYGCSPFDACGDNPFSRNGSFYDPELSYLENLVVPSKVKLNASGHYDPNGTEYTIKSADVGDDYLSHMYKSIIYADGIEYIDGLDSHLFPVLELIRLPKSLKEMPSIVHNSTLGTKNIVIAIPRSITTLPSNTFRTYTFDIYIPKEVTTIEPGAFSFICADDYTYYNFYAETEEVKNIIIDRFYNSCSNSYMDISYYITVDPTKFDY